MKNKLFILTLIFCILPSNFNVYATELEFDEEALQSREKINQTTEYGVQDSLASDYDVEDIFSGKISSREGLYTTEGLFEENLEEVSLVRGEFDELFMEDLSYHDIYVKETKSSIIYKLIVVLLLILLSYVLTKIYLLLRIRRKNAKIKNRIPQK